MDKIVRYMSEGNWKDDEKAGRKRYLFELAQESKSQIEISHKIGGMLIYNQVIEEFLKDIVEYSVNYIKAEIWPAQVQMKFDFSKATFGNLINQFKQYATIEHNRDIIIKELTLYKEKRNQVVHNLFNIEDFDKLSSELNEYALIADEIVYLLIEYDNSICEKFCDLADRIDFNEFTEL